MGRIHNINTANGKKNHAIELMDNKIVRAKCYIMNQKTLEYRLMKLQWVLEHQQKSLSLYKPFRHLSFWDRSHLNTWLLRPGLVESCAHAQ